MTRDIEVPQAAAGILGIGDRVGSEIGAMTAGEQAMHRLDELAACSEAPGEVTRLYLTDAHREAAGMVAGWMREAGMSARLDAAGTVVGRYEGAAPGLPALLLGSHIDSVRNAGRYDGTFGVVAAIEAVRRLAGSGWRPDFAVEILAFGDEEGVRFPVTLSGSKAAAGIFEASDLEAEDEDGIALGEALRRFGVDPGAITAEARDPARVHGYIELHIEQGPVLENEHLPVGVVTAINGASRFQIELAGVAGHAGTVPMSLRRDALAAAAEMLLHAEFEARRTEGLVATVGRVEVSPGAVNVIPAVARFTLDIRSPSDAVRTAAIARILDRFEDIASHRYVGLKLRRTYEEPAAVCEPALVTQMEMAVARTGFRPWRLASGAGHDGLAMVSLCPIAMLFVRCEGGISHNPAEAITARDADVAIRVLIDFLRNFIPIAK